MGGNVGELGDLDSPILLLPYSNSNEYRMAASSDHEHHDSANHSNRSKKRGPNATKLGGLAIVALAAVYSFAAPKLNDRFGWSLPAVHTDSHGNVRLDEKKATPAAPKIAAKASQSNASPRNAPASPKTHSKSRSAPASPKATSSVPKPSGEDLLYGILQEVSRDRYVSPQGLLYTPGSAEGHRLKHLQRHTKDQPNRPGKHGVFDGGMEKALSTIDRAYERAKKKQRTTVTQEEGRTIYTVDMGGRIGFIGGQDGKRKRNPMARRVRMVLDGNRVITAFPM